MWQSYHQLLNINDFDSHLWHIKTPEMTGTKSKFRLAFRFQLDYWPATGRNFSGIFNLGSLRGGRGKPRDKELAGQWRLHFSAAACYEAKGSWQEVARGGHQIRNWTQQLFELWSIFQFLRYSARGFSQSVFHHFSTKFWDCFSSPWHQVLR